MTARTTTNVRYVVDLIHELTLVVQPKLRWNARMLETCFHLSAEIAELTESATTEQLLAFVINAAVTTLPADIVISTIYLAKGGLKITSTQFNMS